ncbi:MAG: TlpA family protein disulfide reductase [Planctomycetaceae bacterium]|nr:TlpA family protein disulfide reductase [Planctomycetaceae bacterium]
MPRHFSLAIALATCLTLPGCGPDGSRSGSTTEEEIVSTEAPAETGAMTPPEEASTSPNTTATPATPQAWEEAGIALKAAQWHEVQAELAKHKGKVVVLDLWSTWCAPCVRELPHLVALQKKHPEQVVCISVNLNFDGSDTPDVHAPEVLQLLAKLDARIINLLSTTPDETIYETIDLASIPVAFVYQNNGELKKRFDNESSEYGDEGFTYQDHVIPLVEELLKAPSPE